MLTIKNAEFSGYCFYMNTNKYGGFQICISVRLNHVRLTTTWFRCSHQRFSGRKDILRNFAKFTGKHCARVSFLIKLQDWGAANLLKKKIWHRCFPVNFAKFLRTPFFKEYLWWLLLKLHAHRLITDALTFSYCYLN